MTTTYEVFNKGIAQESLSEDPDDPDDIMAFETMKTLWYNDLPFDH
jgi:hypothetical protein